MRDPFAFLQIPALSQAVQPYADKYHLPVLPLHIHEALAAALFYTFVHIVVSPWISNKYFPSYYPKSRGKKANWDSHVVSLVQSVLINAVALAYIFVDEERKGMNWMERIWGYTGSSGLVQSMAVGYFLWDLITTLLFIDVFGLGVLAHAVSALTVYSFGYRPFLNYYGNIFILYELSTPFLNVHWFCDKLNLTGSKLQLYNGITLLFTFFSCRLVFGTYQSAWVYYDMWRAMYAAPITEYASFTLVDEKLPGAEDIMVFSKEADKLPVWLVVTYVASNLVLNGLNWHWFFKMIKAVRKRFEPAKEGDKEKPAVQGASTTGVQLQEKIEELRKRGVSIPEIEIDDDFGEIA